jgi:ammonia channel protein AmtB
MITIMAMSTAGISFIAMRGWFNSIIHGNNFGCFYIANAMLSGAVSISATCDSIEVWHGVLISLVGTLLYSLCSKLLLRSDIDDPQEAFLIFGV